ncbi:MAG: response regulator [Synechococcales bacterium]|nr:response regulator [Synechococcales bacterium]
MNVDANGLTKLVQNLKVLQAKDATGKLTIALANAPDRMLWQVCFNNGQLLWITSCEHRVRGWLRALKQAAPQLVQEYWLTEMSELLTSAQAKPQEHDSCWEIQLLNQALCSQTITRQQAQAVIQTRLQELCLSLVDKPQLSLNWLVFPYEAESIWMGVAVDQVIKPVLELCQQWRTQLSPQLQADSMRISLNHALVVLQPERLAQKVPAPVHSALSRLLNGRHSFWDIAQQMQKPLVPLMQFLLPLLQEELIQLREIPDLKVQSPKPSTESSATFLNGGDRAPSSLDQPPTLLPGAFPLGSGTSFLSHPSSRRIIACIDDSPVVAKELEAILKPMGYSLLHIVDPVQGVSHLLKQKPALIFLDVMMPNINGYEFCTFLRKTAAFKEVPIVMLTSHNGIFDRMRAKNVGSSDFMSKPPTPSKVIMIINKYLTPSTAGIPSSS